MMEYHLEMTTEYERLRGRVWQTTKLAPHVLLEKGDVLQFEPDHLLGLILLPLYSIFPYVEQIVKSHQDKFPNCHVQTCSALLSPRLSDIF